MPPRFFCQTRLPRKHFPLTLALDDNAAQHVRVLRLAVGDAVTLFNGDDANSGEAAAFIKTLDKKTVSVEISAWRNISRESPLNITLMQSLATGDKMDLIIQKAVELGVSAVIPVRAARSTIKLDAERAEKRVAHWRGVAIAASEQCGRNVVANISAIQSFDESLISAGTLGVLHPEIAANTSVSLIRWAQQHAEKPLAILIGPEGGFTDAEVALAVSHGATVISLGQRVLRTETAGLAAIAILQSHLGDLG
jgi:16S rRNA (uracil1498-N3)-methyltransferase